MKIIKLKKSQYSDFKGVILNTPFVSRFLFVTIILLLIKVLFSVKISLIIFLVIVTAFNAWLAGFQLKRGLPTDLELSTFATVLVTNNFGIEWGIFTAVFSKLFASIYTGNVIVDHFFMISTYLIAAVITWLFGGPNILALGIFIVILNAFIMFLLSKNILGIDITANLSYTGTNLMFNLVVFLIFSQPLQYML